MGKIGKRVGLGDSEDDEELGFGFEEENLLDFEDYVFDTPAELLTEQNRNKFGEEIGVKDRGGTDTGKRGGPLSSSFMAGGPPTAMADSVASSTSSMDGSDDDEFDDDEFDDEYDSDESDEEEEEEDSFGLDLSV